MIMKFVQSKLPVLNKKEILTHKHKESYFVERIVENYLVNQNITFIREKIIQNILIIISLWKIWI